MQFSLFALALLPTLMSYALAANGQFARRGELYDRDAAIADYEEAIMARDALNDEIR